MSSSRRPRGVVLLATLALAAAAQADELSATATLVPELHSRNAGSVIDQLAPASSFSRRRGRADLEVQWHSHGLNFVGTGRASFREGKRTRYESVVNELYWDGRTLGQHVTLGRKIMSWDVGFAFRPLDVLQRDDRRVLFASTFEGIDVLAWEHYDEASAWTVAYANPSAGTSSMPRGDESLAARYYRRIEALDLYVIGRASDRLGLEAGSAASFVASEGIELHASFRYQQKLARPLLRANAGLPAAPVLGRSLETVNSRNEVAALVGGTWTHQNGVSLLSEWWYDPAGHSRREWRDALGLLRDGERQRHEGLPLHAATGIALTGTGRYLEQPNLLRHNLLLRISHQRETLQRSFDVLWTPEDGGLVATLAAAYGWNRHHISGGVRLFGGSSSSVYRALPEDAVAFCAWRISW